MAFISNAFLKFYFALGLLTVLLLPNLAQAQNVDEHISLTNIPEWVSPLELREEEFVLAEELALAWRVLSYQSKVDPNSVHEYRRFVKELQTVAAIEDNGTITVRFDPGYQTVEFHRLAIHRDGEINSILNLDAFELFRVETDRDKLMYNGELQLSFSISDLRAGDKIEYAYSVIGQNPALLGAYFDHQAQEFTTPYQRFRSRILVHEDLPIYRKFFKNAVEGEKTKSGNYNIFEINLADRPAAIMDDDMPDWYYWRPAVEVSTAETWKDVGDHFAPYYTLTDGLPKDVKVIVDQIKQDADDPKAQARAALDYVQSNIRYLSVELGESGFIPRAPALVLQRRFGDCKDMTFLLKAILEGLGFEAFPLLVDTDERAGFVLSQPNHVAFDHVLLRVMVDGEDYFMDATTGQQLGDLDHYDQGDIQKGLLLKPNQSQVIEVETTSPEWLKDIYYKFDLSQEGKTISFKTEERLYGSLADSSKRWLERDGFEEFQKSYLDYYSNRFSGLKYESPLEITYDERTALKTIKTSFVIPNAWTINSDNTRETFYAAPYDLANDFPKFDGAVRLSDYKISFPTRTRHSVKFILGDNWELEEDSSSFETDAISYAVKETFQDNIYTELYSYIAKADHIDAEDFSETMERIDEIRDDMGVTLWRALPGAESEASSDNTPNWVLHVWATLLLLGFGFYVERLRRTLRLKKEVQNAA